MQVLAISCGQNEVNMSWLVLNNVRWETTNRRRKKNLVTRKRSREGSKPRSRREKERVKERARYREVPIDKEIREDKH